MKRTMLTVAAMIVCVPAAFADPNCQEQATGKKLAGAALNSF